MSSHPVLPSRKSYSRGVVTSARRMRQPGHSVSSPIPISVTANPTPPQLHDRGHGDRPDRGCAIGVGLRFSSLLSDQPPLSGRKSRFRSETPEFNHAAGISANPEELLVGVADYTAEIGFSLPGHLRGIDMPAVRCGGSTLSLTPHEGRIVTSMSPPSVPSRPISSVLLQAGNSQVDTGEN